MFDYPATILVMEDETDYASIILRTFTDAGYKTFFASDLATLFAACCQYQIALALINIDVKRWDGIAASLALQGVVGIPTIALVRSAITRRQTQFLIETAEEYITKPFTSSELFWRSAALLRNRRSIHQPGNLVAVGDLILNQAKKKLWISDHSLFLTPNECKLAGYLMEHPGQTLRKKDLIRAVWGSCFYNDENALRVLVGRLRKKIEQDTSHPTHLLTVQSIGYRLQSLYKSPGSSKESIVSFFSTLPGLSGLQQKPQDRTSPAEDDSLHEPPPPYEYSRPDPPGG